MLTASLIEKFLPYGMIAVGGLVLFCIYKYQTAKIKKLEKELEQKKKLILSQKVSLEAFHENTEIAREQTEAKKRVKAAKYEKILRDDEIIKKAKEKNDDKEVWKNIDNIFDDLIGK